MNRKLLLCGAVFVMAPLFWGYLKERYDALLLDGVHRNNLQEVTCALQHGANPNLLDPMRGRQFASRMKALRWLQQFWYGHPLYKDGLPLLTEAAAKDDKRIVALLIRYGAKVNPKVWPKQETPLTLAAQEGRWEVVELLLKAGADPNLRDGYGDTALFAAVDVYQARLFNGIDLALALKEKEIVEVLLKRGANPNLSNPRLGEYPLTSLVYGMSINYCGALRGFRRMDKKVFKVGLEMLHLLLGYGARVDTADRTGLTPLQRACMYVCPPVAKLLIKAGANVNRSDVCSTPPLLEVLSVGWKVSPAATEQLCDLLVKAGADVHVSDDVGLTPIECTQYYPNGRQIRAILEDRSSGSSDRGGERG